MENADFRKLIVTEENFEKFRTLFLKHKTPGVDEGDAVSIGFLTLMEVKEKNPDLDDLIPFLISFYKYRLIDHYRKMTKSRIAKNHNKEFSSYQLTTEMDLDKMEDEKSENFEFLSVIKNDLEREIAYLLSIGTPVATICKSYGLNYFKIKQIKKSLSAIYKEALMEEE